MCGKAKCRCTQLVADPKRKGNGVVEVYIE
jgi:hypothetical protein